MVRLCVWLCACDCMCGCVWLCVTVCAFVCVCHGGCGCGVCVCVCGWGGQTCLCTNWRVNFNYTHGKRKLYIKIGSKRFSVTKFSTNYHCPHPDILQLILCYIQWSCFVNIHVKSTLCTHVGRQGGAQSHFNRLSVVLDLGSQKNTFFIYRHVLLICVTCHNWHLMLNYKAARPRGRMCTCAHQGCALAQSLPNCWSYCPDHPWTASNQWENCEEQPRCTPHTGHYCCLATIEHGCNSRKTTRDGDLYSENILTGGRGGGGGGGGGGAHMDELHLSPWRAIWMGNGTGMKSSANTFTLCSRSWHCSKNNSRPHIPRVVMGFLCLQNIQVME